MTTASELRRSLEAGGTHDLAASLERNAAMNEDIALDLQRWLSGEESGDNSVRSDIAFHGRLHLNRYVLVGLNGDLDTEALALSTRCLSAELRYCLRVHERFPRNLQMVSMENMGLTLAQTITTGWRDHAELQARLSLEAYPGVLQDGVAFAEYPYFMLELVKDWLGADVSLASEYRASESYKNSRPTGSAVWWDLLEVWREPDAARFDEVLTRAAEHYVEQSRIVDREDVFFEFGDVAYWVFPVVLLSVLRLREWAGLRNPEPSHDLFQVSRLGQLPPVPPYPSHEIYDAVEAKYASVLPELPPLLTLSNLPELRERQS